MALYWLLLAALQLPADEPAGEAASTLPQDELESRREALKARIFEPAVLEASSFRLAFERSSSSIHLEDRRTGTGWHSSLARKGFASLVLREGGEARRIDLVDDLRVEEKEIRFRGRSSGGEVPEIRFSLRVLDPLVGLEIGFELPAPGGEKVLQVRLLEGMPWVADADGGGAILPRGLGEWLPADSGPAFERSFRRDEGAWSGARPPVEPASLPAMGMVRGTAALLLIWEGEGALLRARRGPVEAAGFPGKSGIISSVDLPPPSGRVRLYPLGKGDAIDIAHSYRQLVGRETEAVNLRRKIGDREALKSLLGAAVLRPRIAERGPGGSPRLIRPFKDVAEVAERWQKVLEIDQVLVILDGWNARAAGEEGSPGPLLPAAACAGGDSALANLALRLKGSGYLLGLGVEDAKGIPEALPALKAHAPPDLLLLRAPREGAPPGAAMALRELGRTVQAELGIAGIDGAGAGWAADFGYLEGLLSHKVLHPVEEPIFPLFAFSHGHTARLAVRPEDAVEPHQPGRILAHLVLGEVPIYAFPSGKAGAGEAGPDGDPSLCLARADGGWAEGTPLSSHERFVKNTFEVLSHVARIRYRAPLLFHRFLTPDRTVEESWFGEDLRVVVNHGGREYADEEAGFTLPPFGFWVQHPFFHAFHATRAHGVEYPRPALFTVRSLEGKMYLRAESVRIYHGFGPSRIQLGGRDFEVAREKTVKIW